MKNLILIRHAKSSWRDPDLQDIERPLNQRGKRDAPSMGRLLKERGLTPDLIVSSPARRACHTARKIAAETGYPKAAIRISEAVYMRGVDALVSLLCSLDDDSQRVYLIGHNPDLTDLANRLSNTYIDEMPTCAVASIDFPFDSWTRVGQEKGKLVLFERPPGPTPNS